MSQEDQFRIHLQRAGERVTTPRLVLFRLLAGHTPILAKALTTEAKSTGLDPVTVYRTLKLFMQIGLIQELGYGRHRRYELAGNLINHHHHLNCLSCGTVIEVESPQVETSLSALAETHSFKIERHQLEIFGVCRTCQKKTEHKL